MEQTKKPPAKPLLKKQQPSVLRNLAKQALKSILKWLVDAGNVALLGLPKFISSLRDKQFLTLKQEFGLVLLNIVTLGIGHFLSWLNDQIKRI